MSILFFGGGRNKLEKNYLPSLFSPNLLSSPLLSSSSPLPLLSLTCDTVRLRTCRRSCRIGRECRVRTSSTMIPGGGVVRFARPSSSSLVCVFFGDGKYINNKYSLICGRRRAGPRQTKQEALLVGLPPNSSTYARVPCIENLAEHPIEALSTCHLP